MRRSTRILAAALTAAALTAPAVAAAAPPETGFETSNGASWTTHEQELAFLSEVDAGSARVEIDEIGRTLQNRPLHLVRLGAPKPNTAVQARKQPTVLYVCSQHGNEPAGREACLKLLRDLAFSGDPATTDLLRKATVLFVPSANPDGRARNSRGNSRGVDINRDHLNLETLEAQAIAAVVRDFQPEVVLDLHEYGPSQPVLYDDDVLLLWPRNLNVHEDVHDLSVRLVDRMARASEAAGYTADEYGQLKVGDYHLAQSAGDGDEGIARNAMGLRHTLGILAETAVSSDPTNSLTELTDNAEVQRRRVRSHGVIAAEALRFIDSRGRKAARVTATAARDKAEEGANRSAPVYFGGADNDAPEPVEILDPPPCAYQLTPDQYGDVSATLALLGAEAERTADGGAVVSMGQAAEPVIPLLLDGRGDRNAVEGTPLDVC